MLHVIHIRWNRIIFAIDKSTSWAQNTNLQERNYFLLYRILHYKYNGMNSQELADFLNEYKKKVEEIETGNAIESNEK
ncbi:MAG: hypothetical protein ACK481_06595 [Candidatus Melainabacteria bacterium]